MKWYEKTVEYKYVIENIYNNNFMPLDGCEEATGDLITSAGSKFLLIEFKREDNSECRKAELGKFREKNQPVSFNDYYKEAFFELSMCSYHHVVIFGAEQEVEKEANEKSNKRMVLKAKNYYGYCNDDVLDLKGYADEKYNNWNDKSKSKYNEILSELKRFNNKEKIKACEKLTTEIKKMLACHMITNEDEFQCSSGYISENGLNKEDFIEYLTKFIRYKYKKNTDSEEGGIISEIRSNVIAVSQDNSEVAIVGLDEFIETAMPDLKNTLQQLQPQQNNKKSEYKRSI